MARLYSPVPHELEHLAARVDEAAVLAGKMPVLEVDDRLVKRRAAHAANGSVVELPAAPPCAAEMRFNSARTIS